MTLLTAPDLLNDAMAAHRTGDVATAERGYQQVLKNDPRNPDALHLLGLIVAAQGNTKDGAAMMKKALTVHPEYPEAHFNLANIYVGQNQFEMAERHFRAAARLQPHNAEAANSLGGALLRLQRYNEAETEFKRALALNPDFPAALANSAALTESTGRFDETLAFYDRILADKPDQADAHYHRGLAFLLRGRLLDGWTEYAWRLKRAQTAAFAGQFPFPYWRGEPLSGKCILVWTEQGLGDEILLAGMVPDLVARGAEVILICSPRLEPLFRRSFPDVHIFPAGGTLSDRVLFERVSYQASFSDLGQSLRPALDAFPQRAAYLQCDENLAQKLRDTYQRKNPRNRLVGVSWRSKSPDTEREKSTALSAWRGVLATPGITFVNLQYGDTAAERKTLRQQSGIELLTDRDIDPVTNVDGFAAQVAAMDLVISASNTTVHVAGALGRPVWTLVPGNRGRLWYWFLQREDSPWYPSMRLFRQADDTWETPLGNVTDALRDWQAATTT